MTSKFMSFVLIAVLSLQSAFALSNITNDELQSIIDEVNQEIEKEVTILDIHTLPETETVAGNCEDKEATTCALESTPTISPTLAPTLSASDELKTAVSLLHSYAVTKFATPETFMPDQAIRRDEVLKMFYVFAKQAKKLPDTDDKRACLFDDLANAHSDIVPMIAIACQHGLFKGSQGKFMPTDSITNAQAVIVLIRMIDGYKDEANVEHYAENYMSTAQNLGLLKNLGISDKTQRDAQATRATIAKLLYRADSK